MGPVMASLRPHYTHPPVGNPFRCERRNAMPPIQLDAISFQVVGIHYCDEPLSYQ
jgi:hypothetical protein